MKTEANAFSRYASPIFSGRPEPSVDDAITPPNTEQTAQMERAIGGYRLVGMPAKREASALLPIAYKVRPNCVCLLTTQNSATTKSMMMTATGAPAMSPWPMIMKLSGIPATIDLDPDMPSTVPVRIEPMASVAMKAEIPM